MMGGSEGGRDSEIGFCLRLGVYSFTIWIEYELF